MATSRRVFTTPLLAHYTIVVLAGCTATRGPEPRPAKSEQFESRESTLVVSGFQTGQINGQLIESPTGSNACYVIEEPNGRRIIFSNEPMSTLMVGAASNGILYSTSDNLKIEHLRIDFGPDGTPNMTVGGVEIEKRMSASEAAQEFERVMRQYQSLSSDAERQLLIQSTKQTNAALGDFLLTIEKVRAAQGASR